VKSPLVFESLDVRLANSEDMPNFPSEEFTYDNIILPTSIQQGKECLDKIIVQHISFKK
ncbi:4820_t:CDS:2, partial [Cetraspora pellucida]